MGLIATAGICK